MILLARFARWCHLMRHLPNLFVSGSGHVAVDSYRSRFVGFPGSLRREVIEVACSCGLVFWP